MKFLTESIGLYIHIPFCEKKCRYCNFYSSFSSEELLDSYKNALIREIKKWGGSINRPIDTVYLGGGTPSLLKDRLPDIINSIKASFSISKNAEITLEMNPTGDCEETLKLAKQTGVNRLSIGAQSGDDKMLSLLGRKHTSEQTQKTFKKARELGFNNISLDLMICLPDSSNETLLKDLEFITALNPEHISAYMLKIEENTAFYFLKDTLNLPCEETQAEQYLFMCDYLEKKGYTHYEISNFCKDNYMSRHNLKYWQGTEYLGLGPSAHSFLDGKRFFYKDDLKAYIKGTEPIFDSEGGTKEEYIMLSLRLKEGILFKAFERKFGKKLPNEFFTKCEFLQKHNLLKIEKDKIYLTNKGMLLQNSIITEILECI